MNTRQKLTIGIAAIFMVTLTIVGVTYAYFVTRVTGEDNGKNVVNVQTAEIASIEYGDGNGVIKMKNVLPGETVYKSFTVTNNDANMTGTYDIYITATDVDGEVAFVHTDDVSTCYTEEAYGILNGEDGDAKTALKAACYKASSPYNNIEYTLYQVDSFPADLSTVGEANKVVVGTDAVEGKVQFGTSEATPQMLVSGVPITPNLTVHNYILKIDYINETGYNQNIENNAALDILVDIK